ncbi:MAG TPA: hypothetical protein VI704_04250 [Bacteroidota bacterium]|nr:hypothetical protein [Bacteroidota bacterium]
MKKLQDYAGAIVFAHVLLMGFDHLAHQRVDLMFALMQNVVLLSVLTVSPLVAAALLWTRFQRAGAILFLSTMAVAFAFNVYHRYLSAHPSVHSPDVAWYWETIFYVSSALILVTEILGCWLGTKIVQKLGTSIEAPSSNG